MNDIDSQEELEPEFECIICSDLYMYPVSISCGHTLCRECLRRALSLKKECPICRVPCLLSPHERLPVNVILQTIIEKKYPKRCAKKKLEVKQEEAKYQKESKEVKETPVMFLEYFVMPETEGYLNLFERRYLQMVTTCLRGDRKFVLMVNREQMRGFVVEIKEATPTPQGSIHARVRGISKFVGTRLYIPEESRNLYLNEESSLWYVDGNKVFDYTDNVAQSEEEKEENKNNEEGKQKETEELAATIPIAEELFELFKERLARMNEPQRRMFTRKFGDFDMNKYADVKKRLALLSFYICGSMVVSPRELETLVFEKSTKDRLEWGLNKLKNANRGEAVLSLEEAIDFNKSSRQSILLIFGIILALIIIKWFKNIGESPYYYY